MDNRFFQRLPVLWLIWLLTGCGGPACCLSLPINDENSVHYLIIGISVLSIPKPENKTAVLATQSHTLGLNLSDQPGMKVGVGYSSSTMVEIPDGAEDVRVEVSQKPGGPLVVNTKEAQLNAR